MLKTVLFQKIFKALISLQKIALKTVLLLFLVKETVECQKVLGSLH